MINNFIQKYYLPPEGVEPVNRVFSAPHLIISSILFILIFCIFYSVLKKKSQSYSQKILLISAILMLMLEVFRISWNIYFKGLSLNCFRFDFCNQICMFLPFIVFAQNKKLYPYVQILAITGGACVLIYPLWVFYDYAGFHIMALQSMVSHGLMLLAGLVMPYAGGYIPKPKDGTEDTLAGFSVILAVAFIMSRLTGENYLLMKNAHGVPFLSSIPFPYYWIVFLIIITLYFFFANNLFHDLVCYSMHIPLDSNQLYGSRLIDEEEHNNQKSFLKLKFLKPFKYRNLKAK